jgi:hypothetical protein
MKTVLVTLDDAEFAELGKLAASQSTTVDGLLKQYAQSLRLGPGEPDAGRRASARQELVAYVRSMKTGVAVGEKPTRERTYSGHRFYRH